MVGLFYVLMYDKLNRNIKGFDVLLISERTLEKPSSASRMLFVRIVPNEPVLMCDESKTRIHVGIKSV